MIDFRRGLSIFGGLAVLACLASVLIPVRAGDMGLGGDSIGPLEWKVTAIARAGPADRAGIRIGDRVAFASSDEFYWGTPGDSVQLRVQRGAQTFATSMTLGAGPQVDPRIALTQAIYIFAFIGIGLVIGLRRPDSPTARWVAIAFVGVGIFINPGMLPMRYGPWIVVFDALATSFCAFATLRALAIFPTAASAGPRPWIGRNAWLFASIWGLPRVLEVVPHTTPRSVQIGVPAMTVAVAIVTGAIIVCVVDALRTARGHDRQRILWVVAGTAVASLLLLARTVFAGIMQQPQWTALFNLGLLAAPLSMAYSILRHRLLDIRIVLNRTLLYGSLTSIVLISFLAVELLLERTFLAGKPAGTAIEIVVVLGVGLSLRPLHDGIAELLDAWIFHTRRDNVAALTAFAETIPTIDDRAMLLARAAEVLAAHSGTACCGIYRRNGDAYILEPGGVGDAPGSLPRDHPLVRRVEAELECVESAIAHPHTTFQIFAPMDVHGELAGLIGLGIRRDEDSYHKTERAAIERVAHGMGRALYLRESTG